MPFLATRGISSRGALLWAALLVQVGLWHPQVGRAHDHVPPRAVLHVDGHRQAGLRGTTLWSRADGANGCRGSESLSEWAFPHGLGVSRGRVSAVIRFAKEQRPESLQISSWRHIDAHENPVGRSRRIGYELQAAGGGAWMASLSPIVRRHLYVHVAARWRDVDGCGGPQDVEWTFHLRARGRTNR